MTKNEAIDETTTECPYPSHVLNGEECNRDNYIWKQGYEAHKFEMAKLAESLETLANELEAEVKEVKEIRDELKTKRK